MLVIPKFVQRGSRILSGHFVGERVCVGPLPNSVSSIYEMVVFLQLKVSFIGVLK